MIQNGYGTQFVDTIHPKALSWPIKNMTLSLSLKKTLLMDVALSLPTLIHPKALSLPIKNMALSLSLKKTLKLDVALGTQFANSYTPQGT